MGRATFFHDKRGGGGIQGTLRDESIDGMGQVFTGDVIQMGPDFHHLVMGGSAMGGGVSQESAKNIRAVREIAGA